ncbi:MAG: preprotein translocase subunit SecE [Actinobacteria bacterium]|nr:preprotein translocase subunit SecE [Actinomycetota bacterium]
MQRDEARKKKQPRPTPKPAGAPGGPGGKGPRTPPRQFFKEVAGELRKVAWPTRQEVIGYSIVVLVSSIVIAAIVFGMDFVFTEAILALFGVDR